MSVAVVLTTWAPWYGDVFRINRLGAPLLFRLILGLTPLVCLLLLFFCLHTLGAKAVRESALYTSVYMTMGAAVLGVSGQLSNLLGVSARDDVLERRNPAALIAIVGVFPGTVLCFAGGNIGEGPGVLAVIASSGAALGAWFVLWFCLELLSGVSERITVERDIACGLRLAGLLVSNGMVLGAAASGDWIPGRFLHDFALSAWPALILTAAAALFEKISGRRSSFLLSVVMISVYLAIAVLWLVHRGLA